MGLVSVRKFTLFLALSLVLPLHAAPDAHAASATEIDAKANATLTQFYEEVPAGRELAAKAAGILIFPSIIKAGFIFGGEYGEGALRVGGFTVDYYDTISASVGFQLGVQAKSLVLLFMTKEVLEDFRNSEGWEAGVDGSIAVNIYGTGGAINTTTAQEPIIGFIFGQKGLMGNLTLEGTKMTRIIK